MNQQKDVFLELGLLILASLVASFIVILSFLGEEFRDKPALIA